MLFIKDASNNGYTFFSPLFLVKALLELVLKEAILVNHYIYTLYYYTIKASDTSVLSVACAGKGGLGNTKFVAFEKLAWHNGCFFCAQCKESMVGKGFIQVGLLLLLLLLLLLFTLIVPICL